MWGPTLDELLTVDDTDLVAGNSSACDKIDDEDTSELDTDDTDSGDDDLLESIAFIDVYDCIDEPL